MKKNLLRRRLAERAQSTSSACKQCRTCRRMLPLRCFAKHHSSKDGHRNSCIACNEKKA